ncbi:MAG: hypothetical protein J7K73_01845 [Nanoarchaeota archaeon]|nr:hypothetical protein [Nanoarchaeota archaeon]
MFGKDKEKIRMLEKMVAALSRSIDDLTAEVKILREEVEELKKKIKKK